MLAIDSIKSYHLLWYFVNKQQFFYMKLSVNQVSVRQYFLLTKSENISIIKNDNQYHCGYYYQK